jgi:hypothetical protein
VLRERRLGRDEQSCAMEDTWRLVCPTVCTVGDNSRAMILHRVSEERRRGRAGGVTPATHRVANHECDSAGRTVAERLFVWQRFGGKDRLKCV